MWHVRLRSRLPVMPCQIKKTQAAASHKAEYNNSGKLWEGSFCCNSGEKKIPPLHVTRQTGLKGPIYSVRTWMVEYLRNPLLTTPSRTYTRLHWRKCMLSVSGLVHICTRIKIICLTQLHSYNLKEHYKEKSIKYCHSKRNNGCKTEIKVTQSVKRWENFIDNMIVAETIYKY